MKSNQRNPFWPFFLLLTALFVLAVAAPRGWKAQPKKGWQDAGMPPAAAAPAPKQRGPVAILKARSDPGDPPSPGANPSRRSPSESAFDRRPMPVIESLPPRIANHKHTQSDVSHDPEPVFLPSAGENAPSDETDLLAPLGPWTSEPRVGGPLVHKDTDPYGIGASPRREGPAPEGVAPPPPPMSAEDRKPAPPSETVALPPNPPATPSSESPPLETADSVDEPPINTSRWPLPANLVEALDQLKKQDRFTAWAGEVSARLDRLASLGIDDPRSSSLLNELQQFCQSPVDGENRLEGSPTDRIAERCRRDLNRRLAVWTAIEPSLRAISAPHTTPEPDGPAESVAAIDPHLDQQVARVLAELEKLSSGARWKDYLLLDSLRQLAARNGRETARERRRVSQTVLERLRPGRLTSSQRQLAKQPAIVELTESLRDWAAAPIDRGVLLHQIEQYESSGLPSDARPIAETMLMLEWSKNPADRRLHEQLTRQFRNANLRLVISGDLLNRLAPQPAVEQEPVHETVVGVPSHGVSTTSTQLSVRLIPDPDKLRVGIEAAGLVDSRTRSTAGPVTFVSQGESNYLARKLVLVRGDGVRVRPAVAEAKTSTNLESLATGFDSVPLLRSVVRNFALSQHEQKQPQARREVEERIAARAAARFDAEIDRRLALAESRFRDRVVQPCDRLGLEPMAVSLQTTPQRLISRVRLSGAKQLAASTARPLILSDSLASLQIHESLLNNALEQLQLAGRRFTLPELHAWIADRVGKGEAPLPADLPERVTVTFAEFDPVTVLCRDDLVELRIAIADLDQGRRNWQDFEVLATYRIKPQGLGLEISRVGAIEIVGEGHEGKVDVILRGIFAKILARERKPTLRLPEIARDSRSNDLEVLEPTIDNGWISLSLGRKSTAHTAGRPATRR